MSQILYYVLYTFFYNIFKCCEYLYKSCVYLFTKLIKRDEENSHLFYKLKSANKPLNHLTVLLGDEEPCYKILANLIYWALATNISFISFYDYKGVLKQHEDDFECFVEKGRRKEDHIIWHKNVNMSHRNGFSGSKIHVKIMTVSDGRKSVVDLCRTLSLSKQSEITVETVDKSLQKIYEFPDPELGIYFGEYFNLHGYPPWQIKVTEFLNVSSQSNFNFVEFCKVILMYNKSEQRFGK